VRRLYSWPVLAASIDAVYREVAGTTPSAGWSMPSGVDLSCRFRSAAHLL
jgi:glycogen synthase